MLTKLYSFSIVYTILFAQCIALYIIKNLDYKSVQKKINLWWNFILACYLFALSA